ncbi:MAG TPA: SDR family oxidoreductase [Flavobacteriaceae bacterium]|nr:SDR family oxidoreductase [Flavobacteriaceae bacterium]
MKNVIITGTSRGIGLEMARIFADAGHQVLALSRSINPIRSLDIPNLVAMEFDMGSKENLVSLKEYLKKQGRKVDILINNAGLLINKPFPDLTAEDFQASYKVNVLGPAFLIQTVLPFMNKSGHVVNISSMGGVRGSVKFPGLSAYSSSKGAIVTLTELLAEEYKATGPSFNALALGSVQTEMLSQAFPGLKAPLSAKEMAQYIVDFAIKGNKYFNGKILEVSSTTP